MSNLFNVLEKVKSQPALYIGSSAIRDLRLFIVGYRFARSEMEISVDPEESDFHKNFQPWLQRRMGILTTKSWDKIILFQSSNETVAFQQFFQLLEEFRQRDQQKDLDPLLSLKDPLELRQSVA